MGFLIFGSKSDPKVENFIFYLQNKSIRYCLVEKIDELKFAYNLGNQNEVILSVGDEIVDPSTAIYAPNIFQLINYKSGFDNKFIAQENFSALWAIFTTWDKMINRPTKWAWNFDYPLSLINNTKRINEYIIFDTIDFCSKVISNKSNQSYHIEYQLSSKRIVESALSPSKIVNEPVKIQVADSNRYFILLVVGNNDAYELLNELNLSKEFILNETTELRSKITKLSINFYCLVFTIWSNQLHLIRVLPNPPFSWYEEKSDQVNTAILKMFNKL